jgi:glutamate formiminotransferase / 5-formyltetrahydrofolate cyclo-ligase
LALFVKACGPVLLDLHTDPDHHRSVFTLAGEAASVGAAAQRLATCVVGHLDLAGHAGAHPRLGVLDVVPFVAFAPDPAPLPRSASTDAVAARDRFTHWLAATLGVPCFRYGPLGGGEVRSLPDVRRRAFADLYPDAGPPAPHPTAGACAVGARGPMIAYNLWVEGVDLRTARSVAAAIRGPAVRALAFDLGVGLQVSCNLIDPLAVGPQDVYREVSRLLTPSAGRIMGCELVGLIPAAVLHRVQSEQWRALDLGPDRTVEARLTATQGGGRPVPQSIFSSERSS